MNTQNHEMTPTERLAAKIADLEAKLALADERIFYLTAQVAELNAKLPTKSPHDAFWQALRI